MTITARSTIAKVSVHQRMNAGILLCHMKKQILPCVTAWLEVQCITLSEISHAEKDKSQLISLTRGVSEKRKGLTEQHSSRLSEPKNGLSVPKGNVTEKDGLGGRDERENGPLRGAHIVRPAACMGKAELHSDDQQHFYSIFLG